MLVEIKVCLSAQILIFYRHITNKSYYTNTISEYKVTVVLHQSVYEVDGRLLYVCIFFLNKPKQYLIKCTDCLTCLDILMQVVNN